MVIPDIGYELLDLLFRSLNDLHEHSVHIDEKAGDLMYLIIFLLSSRRADSSLVSIFLASRLALAVPALGAHPQGSIPGTGINSSRKTHDGFR